MEIKLIVKLETEGATREQLEAIPEEVRRYLEGKMLDWAPQGVTVELEA